ncbi:MAG: putative glycosyltransferase [Candidatus Woesebacteria bacterium GW2011_GWB1_39_12]|uniref:Putative glycosyltransferase n=2 Tax=Candidatus Woeseibacteriota TaxID=1752722 RepID=A0A0G0PGW7_9BACT|nr:MAG: putative glycosyltransferase [Candidatus Woesebacteria bacterium GW2011_GWA1_39_12]KKR00383.1 MAG: putative glycosyltransferase [Candidatus Woesebacteria bacterium GW2011_GWB1_39_12]
MKILMLVPYLPTITMSGGQTRWYNIIKYLAKKHDITLFSLIKDESERQFIPELKKYCKKVEVFYRPKKPWTVRNILLSVFGPFPLLVVRNSSLEERRAIKKELLKEKYDLIHAETFYVMPHLGKTNVPTILVEQTIWHDVYKHHVVNEIPFFLRPFFMQDVLKVKFWEKYYWSKADRLFAVSEEDRDAMLALVPKKEVGIIPNGVDCHFFTEKRREKRLPPRILYGVTNFEWLQNQEATKILIEEVWPRIKKVNPNAKVWIVGRKMPYWLKNLSKNEDIEVTENIPDARDAYRRASVMVAPIKGAGGTRLKILEAMAAGLPVISTSVGVAGLKLTDKVNVLIADTPEEIAERTIMLLKDERLSEIIGEAGRKHVQKNFDWESIVKLHDPVYRELAKRK